MNVKRKTVTMQFGEFGKASVRKLRDSMFDAEDFDGQSYFTEDEVQIVFSGNQQVPVWEARALAD